jgi:hypothetical protein
LSLSSDFLVSKFALTFNLYRYTERLLEAVKQCGGHDWEAIALQLSQVGLCTRRMQLAHST